MGVKLFGRAKISEDAFPDENWLERCETKNDATRKPTCNNCRDDLCCSYC